MCLSFIDFCGGGVCTSRELGAKEGAAVVAGVQFIFRCLCMANMKP